jgi:hypothetical protein
MILKIIAVFVKEMTFLPLKLGQGFFTRDTP